MVPATEAARRTDYGRPRGQGELPAGALLGDGEAKREVRLGYVAPGLQADRTRTPGSYGVLPNLRFPAGRSWLVPTLRDDDWSCVGGSAELVGSFLAHPDLQARPVRLGEDATPPRAF